MPRSSVTNDSNDRTILVNEDYNQANHDEVTSRVTNSSYHNHDPGNVSSVLDDGSVVQSVSGLPASQQMQRILNSDNLPHDKKRRVQWAFVLIGISTSLPWNFLITPMDYWNYKYRNITENETDFDDTTGHTHTKTELQTFFASYLSIASNVPFLLALLVLTVFDQKISQDFRTILGLVAITVLFIYTTVFVEINTDTFQDVFFWLTLSSVVILSIFSAILQGAFVSTAACFPSRNMLAYTSGQSVSGILAVVVQIFSMSGHVAPTKSGLYYFLTADAILIITLAVYFSLPKFEYFNFWSKQVMNDSGSVTNSINDNSYGTTYDTEQNSPSVQSGINDYTVSSSITSSTKSLWHACVATKWHSLANLSINWMTMAVFPPLTVLVNPVNPNRSIWSGRFFIPITNFLLYNLSDFVGRIITNYVPMKVTSGVSIASLSMARWLLVPLLMLCNAHPRNHLPVLIESDSIFIFLIIITGLSNGYLFMNTMINGPKYAPPEIKAQVGFVSVLVMGFGVAAGSLTSNFILRSL